MRITWNNSVNRHDAQKSKIIEIGKTWLSTPKKSHKYSYTPSYPHYPQKNYRNRCFVKYFINLNNILNQSFFIEIISICVIIFTYLQFYI